MVSTNPLTTLERQYVVTLEQNIQEAIRFLAPKFEITPNMLAKFKRHSSAVFEINDGAEVIPEPRSKTKARYHYGDARFEFTMESIDNLKTLGHEVTHYLHHELNPELQKRMDEIGPEKIEYWRGLELQELLGEYGGIVYMTSKGESFSPGSFWNFVSKGTPGMYSVLSDRAYNRAYDRADKAFMEHGETLLPKLARMSLEEAEQLPRILPINIYERRILPLIDRVRRNR